MFGNYNRKEEKSQTIKNKTQNEKFKNKKQK